MKLSDTLKAKRAAKLERQKALLDGAAGRPDDKKDLTAEELNEFEALDKELDKLDVDIATAEKAEKRQEASGAASPNTPVAPQPAAAKATETPAAPAATTETKSIIEFTGDKRKDVAIRIGTLCAGIVGAGQKRIYDAQGILKHIEDAGFGQIAEHYKDQDDAYQREAEKNPRAKSLNTLVSAQGGLLVPIERRNEIIDLLYPTTAYFRGNPVTVPMPNGNFSQPAAATGASAAYRGEGARAAVSEPTFRDLDMRAFILSSIVPITDQLLRYSEGGVAQWTENNLRIVMSQKADSTLLRSAGGANTPVGIFNSPAAVRTAAAAGATPTIAVLETDFRNAENRFTDLNIPGFGATWVMNPRAIGRLYDMRDANGNRYFPEIGGDNPMFRGKRVLSTQQLPNNLGAGTNETEIALVDWNWVWYGDAVPLRLKFSGEATVYFNGDWQSAFQQGLYYIMAEMEHDTEVAMTGSVQVITGVLWQ